MNNRPSLVHGNDLTNNSESRAVLATKCLAVFEVVLIVCTWPLWWGSSAFPEVPLLTSLPTSVTHVAVIGLMLACTTIVLLPFNARPQRFNNDSRAALLCSILLVISNQHRLQSWHWLTMLNLTWLLVLPRKDLLTAMRQTVAAVYVCSALSRISVTPEQSVVGIIVRQLLELVGLNGWERSPMHITWLCHALSFGEFLTGVLLLFPRSEWIGKSGAILLHGSLLLALGPFGLNHHAGVLLWNLCFLCLVPILFPSRAVMQTIPERSSRPLRTVIAITWLFPLSGLLGIADNWPSWQLYSSRPESWILSVHEGDRRLLPQALQHLVTDPAPLSDWCAVKLDRWSLEQTESPMYPEDRFQRAVIQNLLAGAPKSIRFRIDISEPEFPLWWKRRQRQITSREALFRTR